jgi:hypothetical protein
MKRDLLLQKITRIQYKKSWHYTNGFNKVKYSLAYFDIASFNKGLPYLNFINKHHSEFGNESTIVALNMLNGMYYCYKNEPKKKLLYSLKLP